MAIRSMTLAGRVLRLNRVMGLQGVNTLHTSSRVQMGFGSHGSDNDPDVLDKEKEKNLSGNLCAYCVLRDQHFRLP